MESGYGTSSDSSSNGGGLRRHGSVTSLQSTGSHGDYNIFITCKLIIETTLPQIIRDKYYYFPHNVSFWVKTVPVFFNLVGVKIGIILVNGNY